MTTHFILSGLLLFFMLVDIAIQKKIASGWGKALILILPLSSIPALAFINAEIENNFFLQMNGIGLFLAFIAWVSGSVGYLLTVGKNQFQFHLFKGLAIALTAIFVLIEAGYWYYIPLFGAGCWIINDLLWNAAFKQKWYYKGDGKGDVFDMTFKTALSMMIAKGILLAGSILTVILLKP